MIWIAIFCGIGALIGFVACGNDSVSDILGFSFGKAALGAVTGMLLGAIVFALPANGIAYAIHHNSQTTVTYDALENINDGTAIHGSFFLGSGTIDSSPAFYYYVVKNGVSYFKSIDASDVAIHQTYDYPDGQPEIRYTNKIPANYWWTIFGPDDHKVDIYVPPNSITTKYILDGKQ